MNLPIIIRAFSMVDAKTTIIIELRRLHSKTINPKEWVSANTLLNLFSFHVGTIMMSPEEVYDAFRELIEEGKIREKDNMQYFQLTDYEKYVKEVEESWKRKKKSKEIKRSLIEKKYKFSD